MNPQTHTSASPRKAAVRPGRYRAAFTLVEMLVVIVVILILAGIVFRMTLPAFSQANKALTVARLEKLKAAIEEFYAEYGQYPPVPYYKNVYQRLDNSAPKDAPVQPLGYEFPWKDGMRSDMTGKFSGQGWENGPLFTFGLMSFLLPRYGKMGDNDANRPWESLFGNRQWTKYNEQTEDTARDKRACKRWEPFLAGVITDDTRERALKGDAYTNNLATVWDGWDRELIYVSPPPHQSYLLFSRGPDGKYNVSNPADRNLPDNKDNIYGDVGYVQH